ncbi:MAG: hypothetical protein ACE5I7_13475 [Candidatus Binatia bacterium]
MATVHRLLAGGFALLLDPFARLSPLVGLTLISAASGVILLFAFRAVSNPKAIRAARQAVQAHLLAVRLYRHDLTVVFRAQQAFLRALAFYLTSMVLPFLVLLLPFGLLFAHLEARYGTRALHPGERTIVRVIGTPETLDHWQLEGTTGVVVDSVPVHIPARHEIDWRVRAAQVGRYELALVNGARRVLKTVRVAGTQEGAAPRRAVASITALFLAPTEMPIDPKAGIVSIRIAYPSLHLALFGWRLHWIVIFLLVSAAVALLLHKRAGVEF